MNSKQTMLSLTLVLVVLLAACATTGRTEPPASSPRLPGTEWTLITLGGESLIEGRAITLRFDKAAIAGSGGCNTYGGSYTVSKDSLTVRDVFWTEMGCMDPEGIMTQEQAYFQALNTVTRYRVNDDGQLELYDAADTLVLVFVVAGE